MKNFEDERVMRRPTLKKVMSKGSGMPSADYDIDLSKESPKGLKSAHSSSNQHASRPEAMLMDFLVRPQSKVDPDVVRARAKQVVQDQHRAKFWSHRGLQSGNIFLVVASAFFPSLSRPS